MSLEQLVSGNGACAPDDMVSGGAASSSSRGAAHANPISRFADAMLGSNFRSRQALERARFQNMQQQQHHFQQQQQHMGNLTHEELALLNQQQMHPEWANEFHAFQQQHPLPYQQHIPPPHMLAPGYVPELEHLRHMQHMERLHEARLADEFIAAGGAGPSHIPFGNAPPGFNQQHLVHGHNRPIQFEQDRQFQDMENAFAGASRNQRVAMAPASSNIGVNSRVIDNVVAPNAVSAGKVAEHASNNALLDGLRERTAARAREIFGKDASTEFINEQVDEFMKEFSVGYHAAGNEADWAQDFSNISLQQSQNDATWAGEFDATVTKPLNADTSGEKSWVEEFESDYKSWGDEFTSLENADGTFADSFDDELRAYLGKDPNATDYEFAENNPYLGDPQAMTLAERFLREGNLVQAVLALEAVVQGDPANAQAWLMLGSTQAECDADGHAIAALRRCVETKIPLKTENADDLTAAWNSSQSSEPSVNQFVLQGLLLLAVSYTNELDTSRAVDFVRRWVELHPKLSSAKPILSNLASTSSISAHELLVERLISLSHTFPDEPDVYEALGIMYNLSREYDLAAQAFRSALHVRPDDYHLWNKLGATCANGGEAREALSAYRRAVELKPQYVRAWVNVGTSYANQAQYEQAMKFYLKSLRMNRDLKHVWSYVRTTVIALRREDLLEFVQTMNLDALEKQFGI